MSFQDWFEENKERLEDLLRGDVEEMLYEAWLAGYEEGLAEMGKFSANLFSDLVGSK